MQLSLARRLRIRWFAGDKHYRPRLIVLDPSEKEGHWKTLRIYRFGIERYPLFSERNQGEYNIPRHWHYYLGGRLSIWKP